MSHEFDGKSDVDAKNGDAKDLIILEGLVTSVDEDGRPNISPMGPKVDESMDRLLLRPFKTSRTYRNLKRHGEGVFHVTDDAELIAHAAVGKVDRPTQSAERVMGFVLKDACRAYEFKVVELDDSEERTTIWTEVVHVNRMRDFFGFHRARHAVLEAAILATRVHMIAKDSILEDFSRLKILVEKTGGEREHRAMRYLEDHVNSFDPGSAKS